MAEITALDNDGSLESFAGAFDAMTKQQEAPAADKPAPATQDTPEPDQPIVATDDGTPADQSAEAAISDNTAIPAQPKPATQAAVSPELTQRMQEADKAKSEAEAVVNRFIQTADTLIPQMQAAIMGEFADIKTRADLLRV